MAAPAQHTWDRGDAGGEGDRGEHSCAGCKAGQGRQAAACSHSLQPCARSCHGCSNATGKKQAEPAGARPPTAHGSRLACAVLRHDSQRQRGLLLKLFCLRQVHSHAHILQHLCLERGQRRQGDE